MAIVLEFNIGSSTVKFDDEFCKGMTKEQVQIILDRIAKIAYPVMLEKEFAQKQSKPLKKSASNVD